MECIVFTKFLVPLTLEEMAERVKELGFDGADLPVRPGIQVTHENAAKLLPEAVRLFKDQGLSVPTIVTSLKSATDEHAEEVIATAADQGVRMLRTGSWSFRPGDNFKDILTQCRRDLESLESLCEKYSVKANFQIHSGSCLNCNVGISLMMLKGRNPEWIGIQIDPGHLEVSGEIQPLAFAMTGEFLHSVNVKSPRYYAMPGSHPGQLDWRILWQPLPEGLVNWRNVFSILKDIGYTDPLSIHGEYPVEKDPDMSSQLIAKDLQFVKGLLNELDM